MKNMSKTKRAYWLICAIVALSMILSCLGFTAVSVHAETPAPSTPVTIQGGQFNSSDSDILKSTSDWSSSFVGEYSGSVVSGIIDLNEKVDPDKNFLDVTKLNIYEEYKDTIPTTPFGINLDTKNGQYYAPGTNSKVLLININDKLGSAYAYTSTEISLEADSFYVFSVWVKTGSFAQNRGAVVKLSGLPYDVGFWNIDNSDELDNPTNEWRGFSEYRIYVATHDSATATLNLQVGDSYTYGEVGNDDYFERVTPTRGYAMFDNVTCHKLSANEFYHETAISSNEVVVADFNINAINSPNRKSELTDNLLTSKENGVIGSFKDGLNGWKTIYKENENSGQYNYVGIYDAGTPFNKENSIGLESEPYTPNGNSDALNQAMGDRNIAILSSKTNANVGLESDEIEIKRNTFYNLSVYANTQNFKTDSNATLRIIGCDNDNFSPVVISDIKGNDDINNRYGWKRYNFFIRGSLINDYKIKLQLWLGFDSNCVGTVLFDEVRLEEIPYSYYSANNSLGTVVAFDTAPETTIDNGRFFEAADYDEAFPLKPSLWETLGEAPEGAASGIILTDEEHYSANASKYFGVNNPVSQIKSMDYNTYLYPTMLLIASDKEGYFGYTSPEVSISKSNYYKLTVTMRTIGMTGSGANLWIEVNDRIISTIKNIKSTNDFTKYEFYFEGDVPFTSGTGIDYSAKLNIALGRSDKNASGSIYVAEAAFETITADVFNEKYNSFKTERNNNSINYDMYSFSAFNFFAYDNTDTNAIKTSNNWVIDSSANYADGKYTYGVFDPLNKNNNSGNAYLPKEITTAYNSLTNKFDNVFTLQTRGTSVTARLINPIKLSSNSYYLITVSMAVVINENTNKSAVGAGLYLNGGAYSDVKFTDIRTTADSMNGYKFVDYQFYVSTNNEDTNAYISASLGAEDVNSQVDGEIYIAYIACTNLGGADESYVESNTLKVIDKHVESDDNQNDENQDPDTDDEETDSDTVNDTERWWLIPSILFGIAIVLAVVGSIIRSLVDKRSRKQRSKQLNSYDRRWGYAGEDTVEESDKFDDDSNEIAPVIEQDVEKFNDDEPEQEKVDAIETETKKQETKKEETLNDFDE